VEDNPNSKRIAVTQDEIIELARQASFTENSGFKGCFVCNPLSLEYFAKLVAEKEREACAKIADEWAVGWPHPSQVIAERIRARGQANG
jgi:hypothetical protein